MNHGLHLTQEFTARIRGAFGRKGEIWLKSLADVLQLTANAWSLELGPPLNNPSYSLLLPAVRNDGSPAVLKLVVPNPELKTEIEALRLFGGRGCVRLLDAEPERGAILLERLVPGKPVLELGDDEKATHLALQVLQDLHATPIRDGPFPEVGDWAKGFERLRAAFNGSTGPFPPPLVERAEADFLDLQGSAGYPRLLHGDLHHGNILSARREPYLAVDPKWVLGEFAYEIGAWLRNPFPDLLKWPDAARLTARRLDQLSMGLGLDRERILAWAVHQAVLAGWWSFEEGDPAWEGWLAVAELLANAG